MSVLPPHLTVAAAFSLARTSLAPACPASEGGLFGYPVPLPSAQFRGAFLTTQTRELPKFSAGDLNFHDLMLADGMHRPHTLFTLRGESVHGFGTGAKIFEQ